MEITSKRLDNDKIKITSFHFNELEKIEIRRQMVMESFEEWKVSITVKNLFDKYVQLNDDEIAANFDDTHARSIEYIKQLPKTIQDFIFRCCEEKINSYNDDNCIVFHRVGKGMDYSEVSKLCDTL